jgi:hypothetical protein
MIKIITTLIPFIKELVFGKKGEYDNDSLGTTLKKWFIFLLIVGSLTLNVVVVERLVKVSLSMVKVQHERDGLKAQVESLKSLKERNEELSKFLDACIARGEIKPNPK